MEPLATPISELTVPLFQARLIEKTALMLAHFAESTREDMLRWRPATGPDSKTTSTMDQIGECAFANRRFIAFLSGQEAPAMPEKFDTFRDVHEAVAELKESARALADVVRKLKTEELAREIQTHRGPFPIALAIQFPVRNMTYHMGQINMIQLLYGDTAFHIDEEFTTL